MKSFNFKGILCLCFLLTANCAVNILAARFYRLLERERKIYLGLKGIDSLAAITYLNLETTTERAKLYEDFWQDKEVASRIQFEERIEYAYREFGRYAPVTDDRIPIYVRYGSPLKREMITPQKKIEVRTSEMVKPAEVWTYKSEGLIFDFVRIANAYKLIAKSEFGSRVLIPYIKELLADTFLTAESLGVLDFVIAAGRFRQKKNLTRLEVYLSIELADTAGTIIARNIKIFDRNDSLVAEKKHLGQPADGMSGTFFDEVNFWLVPELYRLEAELTDIKQKLVGRKTIWVDLIDYQEDAKEISDIVAARLIDDAFSHEKFNKPVGRVMPLTINSIPIHKPFYFYTEVYNLETKDGIHELRTTYEVYNKTKMKQEIVDVMIKDWIEPGDIAYLATEYHPMDLDPGFYIIVLKAKDLITEKERSAVAEFELVSTE